MKVDGTWWSSCSSNSSCVQDYPKSFTLGPTYSLGRGNEAFLYSTNDCSGDKKYAYITDDRLAQEDSVSYWDLNRARLGELFYGMAIKIKFSNQIFRTVSGNSRSLDSFYSYEDKDGCHPRFPNWSGSQHYLGYWYGNWPMSVVQIVPVDNPPAISFDPFFTVE